MSTYADDGMQVCGDWDFSQREKRSNAVEARCNIKRDAGRTRGDSMPVRSIFSSYALLCIYRLSLSLSIKCILVLVSVVFFFA